MANEEESLQPPPDKPKQRRSKTGPYAGRKTKTHKIQRRHRAIAKDVTWRGKSLYQSMQDHGYKKSVAKSGYYKMNKRFPSLWNAIQEEMKLWAEMSTKHLPDPDTRANIARMRLMHTITSATAKDADANTAAKLIGQDREVGMFEPDMAVGILAMNVPPDFKSHMYSLPDETPAAQERLNDPVIVEGDVPTEDTGTPDVKKG